MPDPLSDHGELSAALRLVASEAEAFLAGIDSARVRPPGNLDQVGVEQELNDLNRRIGELVLEDGRVYFGTTDYGGRVAFRPAIVNWRTREDDVDLIVPLVRELGVRSGAQARPA